MKEATEHYRAGRLAEAITAAGAAVKAQPGDPAARTFLCELLCFAGDLERADKQLDALGDLQPETITTLAVFRQLIRGELARGDVFRQGRVPDFLEGTAPSPETQLRLRAAVELRAGNGQAALALLEQAEEARVPVSGTCNGQPFDDWRDLNDLTASVLEVLTSTGKYFWVPFDQIEQIEFRAPQRARDLLWRPVLLSVRGGPDGEVYLPVLYSGTAQESDDQARLGRITDWRGGDDAPNSGIGQRLFQFGEQVVPILELKQLEINPPSAA